MLCGPTWCVPPRTLHATRTSRIATIFSSRRPLCLFALGLLDSTITALLSRLLRTLVRKSASCCRTTRLLLRFVRLTVRRTVVSASATRAMRNVMVSARPRRAFVLTRPRSPQFLLESPKSSMPHGLRTATCSRRERSASKSVRRPAGPRTGHVVARGALCTSPRRSTPVSRALAMVPGPRRTVIPSPRRLLSDALMARCPVPSTVRMSV